MPPLLLPSSPLPPVSVAAIGQLQGQWAVEAWALVACLRLCFLYELRLVAQRIIWPDARTCRGLRRWKDTHAAGFQVRVSG